MSIQNFKEYSNWKVADTSEIVLAGGFTFGYKQQLRQIIPHVYKHGNGGGTERIRAKIYADFARTKLLHTGDWFELSSITTLSEYWRGRIPLEFSGLPWIDTGKTYYVALEVGNYTRNALTFYIAFMLDDDGSINDNSSATGLAIEFYGYRSKDTAES